MEPLEIIAGPVDVFLAPVGTAAPDVSATPAGNWVKLGTAGSKNYNEDGVAVAHEQEVEEFTPLGRTGPVKAFRTKEGLRISLMLHDLSLDQYKRALNNGTVTDVAAGSGTAGISKLPLRRGADVSTHALLLKGAFSPEGESWSMQYQVPKVYVAGEPEVVFKKGEPAGLALEFVALEDPDATAGQEFGFLVVQSADPS